MPNNIEIKAKVHDMPYLENNVRNLTQTQSEPILLFQEDYFFSVQHGRLKLRVLSSCLAELIFYDRPNVAGPKQSAYSKTEISDPQALKETLANALGIMGVVRKTRKLYLYEQTRIHLDDVEGLGHFMELEVMLQDDQANEDGAAIAEKIMRQLHIAPQDLVDVAYIDLLKLKQQ